MDRNFFRSGLEKTITRKSWRKGSRGWQELL